MNQPISPLLKFFIRFGVMLQIGVSLWMVIVGYQIHKEFQNNNNLFFGERSGETNTAIEELALIRHGDPYAQSIIESTLVGNIDILAAEVSQTSGDEARRLTALSWAKRYFTIYPSIDPVLLKHLTEVLAPFPIANGSSRYSEGKGFQLLLAPPSMTSPTFPAEMFPAGESMH